MTLNESAAGPRESRAPQGYRKVIVGYDGSDNAKRAVERAASVAASTGAHLGIVVVVNPFVPVYGPISYYPPDFADQVTKEGQKFLDEAMSIAKKFTQDVGGSVEQGHAAQIILELADSEAADLIVLGRRGISGIERFVMGGVSSSVVGHSKCDVLIVK
jgi:nucleotide-binding universal stress UspA family protein